MNQRKMLTRCSFISLTNQAHFVTMPAMKRLNLHPTITSAAAAASQTSGLDCCTA
ncbi:MAG: hypothetical protein IPH82_24350 [Chloroflexi bacterium]|nr:hypothetical protein [Chloroflexota bacterium]